MLLLPEASFLPFNEVNAIPITNKIMDNKPKITCVPVLHSPKKIALNSVVPTNCIPVEIGIVLETPIKLTDFN